MSQATDPWTIKRLLEWTTDFLRRAGSASPRLDAEVLLAHARGCQRIELYTSFDKEPTETQRTQFRDHVKQRAAGMPVAYLVGKREFYSLDFIVTPAVLIPRPETEHLVVTLVECLKSYSASGPLRIADIGAGSGVLAVCAAKAAPSARITAIDISADALDVARRNAEKHGVAQRIDFSTGDLLTNLPADAKFDFILSNPPYVAERELASLAPDVRDFEPHTALVAGPKGTEIIQRLAAQAALHLVPGGYLIFELGPAIAGASMEIVRSHPEFTEPVLRKDLAGLARWIVARRN